MKWLISLVLALVMVTPAFAGQDLYLAIVGNDINVNPFYISDKYSQFVYDQENWLFVPVCETGAAIPGAYQNITLNPQDHKRVDLKYAAGCEQFRSNSAVISPEVCDASGKASGPIQNRIYLDRGNFTAKVDHGNAGWYEWYVRLPKKPTGQINLVLQCGVLKPNAWLDQYPYEYDSIYFCAGETGERIGDGFCTREEVDPGRNPIVANALPYITAKAYKGPFNPNAAWDKAAPFTLTAWQNPGKYWFSGTLENKIADGRTVPLTGDPVYNRILLKSCIDKSIVVKLPVTGQQNGAGNSEFDLEEGDLIYVRMDIPRDNTVDIYCHEQSLRLMGLGEPR